MDIVNHIENMRSKPEHINKRYAFGVSFTISFAIFAVWIGSYAITNTSVMAKDDKKNDIVVDSPAISLTASVFNTVKDIKDIIFSPKKVEYSSENMPAGVLEVK